MTLTPDERKAVLAMVVERIIGELSDVRRNLRDRYTVSVAEAARVSGWNERWIRRNLAKVIKVAEGQNDGIELGDLTRAMDERKGGKKKS